MQSQCEGLLYQHRFHSEMSDQLADRSCKQSSHSDRNRTCRKKIPFSIQHLEFHNVLANSECVSLTFNLLSYVIYVLTQVFIPFPLVPSSYISKRYGGMKDWLYTSPLEVQYFGTNLTDGVWLPATLVPKCSDAGFTNAPKGGVVGNTACGFDKKTGAPLPDIAMVTATLPLGGVNVTGIRYAFRDDPCCPGVDRSVMPCPSASCPIQGYNSTLPAVPFVAKIDHTDNIPRDILVHIHSLVHSVFIILKKKRGTGAVLQYIRLIMVNLQQGRGANLTSKSDTLIVSSSFC